MRVAGVAGDEDPWQLGVSQWRRHIVKAVGHSLANLVNGEPGHAFHIERVRVQHALCGGDNSLLGVLLAQGVALGRVGLAQVHVQANHVAALARNQQNIAVVSRLDRCFEPNIRKVGHGQHVDDTPSVVGEASLRNGANGLAHLAARTIAAHDILGSDRAFLPAGQVTQGHDHRIVAIRLNGQFDKFKVVVGLKPRGRHAHVVQQVLLQARLIHNDMRHFGQAVFGVLNAPGTCDLTTVLRGRTPEHGLVHPVGLSNELLPQTKGLEHFYRATGHTVGLAKLQWAVSAFDQTGADAWKGRELRRQQ